MVVKLFKSLALALILMTSSSCDLVMMNRGKAPLAELKYLRGAENFDVSSFFGSNLKGFAIILDDKNDIMDTIEISSSGSWNQNKGTIKFEYKYSDKKDYRTWLITKHDSGDFSIVGHDFVGSAKGRQSGNISEIIYKMSYEFNKVESEIEFTDNIYQVNKDSVVVITELRSNGKKIGKIVGSLQKSEGAVKISKQVEPESAPILNNSSKSSNSNVQPSALNDNDKVTPSDSSAAVSIKI